MAQWHFLDASGEEQGPYDILQMRSWYEQGYFTADQLLAPAAPGARRYLPLHQLWPEADAFTVAAAETSAAAAAAAAALEVGSRKRRRPASPPPLPEVPVIDLRTATLDELYQDRLIRPAPPESAPAPPDTFTHVEPVNGERVNVVEGLALHREVLSAAEQRHLLQFCWRLKALGGAGELTGRTYAAPPKWRRGNGRVTVQFGCCYNYAGVFSAEGRWEPAGILPEQRVCAPPPRAMISLDLRSRAPRPAAISGALPRSAPRSAPRSPLDLRQASCRRCCSMWWSAWRHAASSPRRRGPTRASSTSTSGATASRLTSTTSTSRVPS